MKYPNIPVLLLALLLISVSCNNDNGPIDESVLLPNVQEMPISESVVSQLFGAYVYEGEGGSKILRLAPYKNRIIATYYEIQGDLPTVDSLRTIGMIDEQFNGASLKFSFIEEEGTFTSSLGNGHLYKRIDSHGYNLALYSLSDTLAGPLVLNYRPDYSEYFGQYQ
ncbi:MAG: hypothetical protein AAGI38_10335 [Bacteroidota bacterium]